MASQRCRGLESNLLGAFVVQKGNFPFIWGNKALLNDITSDQKVLFSVFMLHCRNCTARFIKTSITGLSFSLFSISSCIIGTLKEVQTAESEPI